MKNNKVENGVILLPKKHRELISTMEVELNVTWFKAHIAPQNKTFAGVVLYTGNRVLSFGDQLWAVPIACLY